MKDASNIISTLKTYIKTHHSSDKRDVSTQTEAEKGLEKEKRCVEKTIEKSTSTIDYKLIFVEKSTCTRSIIPPIRDSSTSTISPPTDTLSTQTTEQTPSRLQYDMSTQTTATKSLNEKCKEAFQLIVALIINPDGFTESSYRRNSLLLREEIDKCGYFTFESQEKERGSLQEDSRINDGSHKIILHEYNPDYGQVAPKHNHKPARRRSDNRRQAKNV